MAKKLGELLVREKLISAAQLQKAREEAKLSGSRLGSSLTKLGYLKENDLANFLGKQYGVQAIDLRNHVMDPSVLEIIPKEIALKHQIVPVNKIGNKLYIAMADPSNVFTIDEIKFMTNYHIEVMIAPEEAIKEAIEKWYAENSAVIDELISDFTEDDIEFMSEEEEDAKETELLRSSEEAPVIKLANYILIDAIKKNASDIHIEPYEKMLRVRYRIDGILYEILKPPLSIKNALVSRIKIMAMLDIAEKRLPQDRWCALRGDGSPEKAQGCLDLPFEDHGRVGYRRTEAPPGRPYQAEDRQGQRNGLPRLGAADPVRRKGGLAALGQEQPAARHDQARLPPGSARPFPGGHV